MWKNAKQSINERIYMTINYEIHQLIVQWCCKLIKKIKKYYLIENTIEFNDTHFNQNIGKR